MRRRSGAFLATPFAERLSVASLHTSDDFSRGFLMSSMSLGKVCYVTGLCSHKERIDRAIEYSRSERKIQQETPSPPTGSGQVEWHTIHFLFHTDDRHEHGFVGKSLIPWHVT